MFICREFKDQGSLPEDLDTRGLVIGDKVVYCGHVGTVTAFREPDSLVSYTADALVTWGKRRSEWVPCRELEKR